MKRFSIAAVAVLATSLAACGGSSGMSRDDAIAELAASAAEDGFENDAFIACLADGTYDALGTDSWSEVVDSLLNETMSEEDSTTIMLSCMESLSEEDLADLMGE